MVQNLGGGVANIQQHAEQRTVLRIGAHALAQGFRVFKRSQRAINPAQDFSQRDFLGRTLQLIAAMGAAQAADDARALQIQKNRLQKLLRQLFFGGDVLDLDDADRDAPPAP